MPQPLCSEEICIKEAEERGFIYPDLAKEFPGYKYELGVPIHPEVTKKFSKHAPKRMLSIYRGEVVGEGGYVWAEPGMYENVVYLDIVSMHPTSIEILQLFGEYTDNYSALKTARLLIKENQLEEAGKMFGGRLAKYLTDGTDPKALSYALKIALNSVYGLTAARYPTKFRDPRNVDNVVAKRRCTIYG